MSQTPAAERRRGRWRAAIAVVGYVAIVALAFRTVDRQRFAEGLANISLLGVLFVLVVSIVHIAGRAFRYHLLLLRASPTNYGVLDGVRIFLIGLSASAVTPARAGDFIKAQLVKKHGVSMATGLGLVFVERSLDLLVVATAIVLSGLALSGRAASDAWLGASLFLLAGLIAGTVTVSIRGLRRRLLSLATRVVRKLRPATDHEALGAKLDSIFVVWDEIFRSPSTFASFFLYSCCVWMVEFMKLWVVLRLVQSPVDPLVTFFVYPASIVAGIVTLLPFSEGVVGVTGVALLVALGGVDSGSATVAVALDRAASTLPPLLLWSGLAFLARRKDARAANLTDAP